MTMMRRCSRTGCGLPAGATLTYVYADQTAVLGRLATTAEPHTYDLCAAHARGLTAPRGWQVVRLISSFERDEPYADDLFAVASAVQIRPFLADPVPVAPAADADRPARPAGPAESARPTVTGEGSGRRGHLRVIP